MKKIILITAKHHSGKSLFAKEIKDLLKENVEVYTGRGMIEESLQEKNLEITRESVRSEGARLSNLSTESGFGVVIDAMIKKVEQSSAQVHLIDSIYYPKAIQAWSSFADRNNYEILLVTINTADEIRLSIGKEKTKNSSFCLEDLNYVDSLENTDNPNEQQLDICISQATTVIENNSTLENFISGITFFAKTNILSLEILAEK